MAPADEGFRADQAAIRQTHLRLIEQLELSPFDRKRKLRLKRQPRLQFPSDGAVEHDVTTAPDGLGAAEGEMAVAQQFVCRPAALRVKGNPDAHPDTMLPRSRVQRTVEGTRDALGKLRDRLGERGTRNGYGKLVAAETGGNTRPSDLGGQPVRDGAQHEIAVGMAEHVIDLLETVEANYQQRDLARLAFRSRDHLGRPGVKGVAIGESGQRIVFGQMPDAFGFPLSHGYVAQDRAILKTVGALPAGEARLDREHLAVVPTSFEFHHRTAGQQ